MVRTGVTSALIAILSAGLLTACGDACDDLSDRCEGCDDPGQMLRCAVFVGDDAADACQQLLDDATFQESCPE